MVGDSLDALLIDTRAKCIARKIATGHRDYCFGVAWSGHLLATASQDHSCRVFDLRKPPPTQSSSLNANAKPSPPAKPSSSSGRGKRRASLQQIMSSSSSSSLASSASLHFGSPLATPCPPPPQNHSIPTQPSDQSVLAVLPSEMCPVRSVAFTPDGSLMAFAESDDWVHVYDVRSGCFDRRQSIDFFGEVGGMALLDNALFIGIAGGPPPPPSNSSNDNGKISIRLLNLCSFYIEGRNRSTNNDALESGRGGGIIEMRRHKPYRLYDHYRCS